MTAKISEKCIKRTKPSLSIKHKTLKCLKCLNSLHIYCSNVDKKQYLSYKNGKKDFICQQCTDYFCLRCDKHAQGFFTIYATFGFIGHVQVLVRSNMKIYKIQTMINPGSLDHAKYICFLSLS